MVNTRISFTRHYYQYSGGHQKVCDYLMHCMAIGLAPTLHLVTRENTFPPIFSDIDHVQYTEEYQPQDSDLVFLAGMDWQHYLPRKSAEQPVINLIQHVKHGDKNSSLFRFLEQPALRLCVSDAVKSAIQPFANGPCETIPMGLAIPNTKQKKTNLLYIQASKQPELGQEISKWAANNHMPSILHNTHQPRETVLAAMAKSHISLVLPNPTEGFFLPGIEAMMLSNIAIVPDCIASRAYCKPFTNALTCPLDASAIIKKLVQAQGLLRSPLSRLLRWRTRYFLKQFSLLNERRALRTALLNHNLL